jgi:hypothetical protein
MKTEQAPLVTFDGLIDPALPAAMQIPKTRAEMPKSGWLDWLERHDRFKLELPGGKFTAYKSAKGYWSAQRRVERKLRHEYLGSSSDLTYEVLDQTARKMNLGSSAYLQEKYPGSRAEQKSNVQSHNDTRYETESEVTSQTQEEISFTEDSAGLKKAIALALAEVEELQVKRKQDLDFSHVRAVGLSAEIEKLETKLQLPALEEIRNRILLRQPPAKRRELKKLLDQFVDELATDDSAIQ